MFKGVFASNLNPSRIDFEFTGFNPFVAGNYFINYHVKTDINTAEKDSNNPVGYFDIFKVSATSCLVSFSKFLTGDYNSITI